MISLKHHVAPNGMPGFRVFAGANCRGTIFHADDREWLGVAPDGQRFGARSKPKIIQRLQIHAARNRVGSCQD